MGNMMADRGAAMRCGDAADHSSAADECGVAPVLPPRWLEMLIQLNQTFDAQPSGTEGS